MRRSELIEGVKNVLGTIERSNVFKVLDSIVNGSHRGQREESAINTDLLTALHKYSLEAAKFGEAEKFVVATMGIAALADVACWPELVVLTPRIMEIRNDLYQAVNFLPKFQKVLEQDNVEVMKHDPSNAPTDLQGKTLLTVIVLEEKAVYSSPHRIIEALESVELFYDAVAILEGERVEQKMILLACDSGSDKSFDLLGIARLVDAVKEIILSLWDRVVFYREQKTGARLELIAQSLPIIEKIAAMEKGGQLQMEQAEILRRKILTGAEKFISAGAIIPEVEHHSHYNPRQLMSPEPKLLAMPSTAAPQTGEASYPASPQTPVEAGGMNASERAEFERLFKQMKQNTKKSSDKPPGEDAGS